MNKSELVKQIEERLGGRPTTGLCRANKETLEGLLDMLVKTSGMAREINILTHENQRLTGLES